MTEDVRHAVYVCKKCGGRYVVLNGSGAPESACIDGKLCEVREAQGE